MADYRDASNPDQTDACVGSEHQWPGQANNQADTANLGILFRKEKKEKDKNKIRLRREATETVGVYGVRNVQIESGKSQLGW